MKIKICGLKTPETIEAAIDAGADFIGFVFYPPSPRHLDIETAAYLRSYIPPHIKVVALMIDAKDNQIDEILNNVRPNMLQLHGNETPGNVAAIKARSHLPVIKAFRIKNQGDIDTIAPYEAVCDWLLFDAKPDNAALPGGTGQSFDWTLLEDRKFSKPWMLSGGLNANNIKTALSFLKPDAIDVSSGVELSPGKKSIALIKELIEKAKN